MAQQRLTTADDAVRALLGLAKAPRPKLDVTSASSGADGEGPPPGGGGGGGAPSDVTPVPYTYIQATTPGSPSDGETWLDTTADPYRLKFWLASAWHPIAPLQTDDLTWVLNPAATGVAYPLRVPAAGVLIGWTLLANLSGSVQLDLWKDTLANYPPTLADTITAAAKPALSAATHAASGALTGWTTAVSAGDVILLNVDSLSTITNIVFSLTVQRT